ncbi:MAG TPA: excinuclease ABC subunit A, partial [candidate division WWE3 bacterium]|nr:excinuclease ABC subunit A [candidate division WWE3 bacterium]
IIPNLTRRHRETQSDFIRRQIQGYMVKEPCPKCAGARLKEIYLGVTIGGKSIHELTQMPLQEAENWLMSLEEKLSSKEWQVAETVLREVHYRLRFLLDVGLGYLNLARNSADLSGGESQRIRLASQIGSGLSGVLYVLDEPSIGLHQRDQARLIKTLQHLRNLGNTVVVVEHDKDTMLQSDFLVDFGLGAGDLGGEVVSFGTPEDVMKDKNSLTGLYLSGKKRVGDAIDEADEDLEPSIERTDLKGKKLVLEGASGRNLKNIDLEIPFGKMVCITGVSGSGKSSLIMDTLLPAVKEHFGLKTDERPLPFKEIKGVSHLDKVVAIDQTPIGRTPRSNPATYTKVFDDIRQLFAQTPQAKMRGYNQGRFSFNVKGGRCETCAGQGEIQIEMQFMPDVYVKCEVCQGKRYNREALEIRYKDKTISDVLDMSVSEALKFFEAFPKIRRQLKVLEEVGLGYIKLGQPAPTLSGGEAQRVKLASELSKNSRGNSLYILDEPTTGLHFADLEKLIKVIRKLVKKGNTVLVIEHNLDVIQSADWVVDLGPEGGEKGGEVIFVGTVGDLKKCKGSYTGEALAENL